MKSVTLLSMHCPVVCLQGEGESSARDVSKRLRRRNGRESDIMGLVGTGVGV